MLSNNMKIYNSVRTVPDKALKKIQGGRLKGMSDINPMWRIKTLTEQFGACGFGWKYEIKRMWLESAPSGEISAFVEINLYIKDNGEWSEPIPGTGGSRFVTKETNGMYMSDECFKMALTDALSVSCKALGVGAAVYWDKDKTKYSRDTETEEVDTETEKDQPPLPPPPPKKETKQQPPKYATKEQLDKLKDYGVEIEKIAKYAKTTIDKIPYEVAEEGITKKEAELQALAEARDAG